MPEIHHFYFFIYLAIVHTSDHIMHRQGVSELQADTHETSPLLTSDDRVHVAENVGGSMVDGAALRRNRQDGENMFFLQNFSTCSECVFKEMTLERRMTTSLKINGK